MITTFTKAEVGGIYLYDGNLTGGSESGSPPNLVGVESVDGGGVGGVCVDDGRCSTLRMRCAHHFISTQSPLWTTLAHACKTRTAAPNHMFICSKDSGANRNPPTPARCACTLAAISSLRTAGDAMSDAGWHRHDTDPMWGADSGPEFVLFAMGC